MVPLIVPVPLAQPEAPKEPITAVPLEEGSTPVTGQLSQAAGSVTVVCACSPKLAKKAISSKPTNKNCLNNAVLGGVVCFMLE